MVLQPHRTRYWLTSPDKLENPEEFQQRVEEVCALYRQAPELDQQGVHVVSCDECTGIQALERKHPTRPAKPGMNELREFESIRHGTLCLIANFFVATGQVLQSTVSATRTEEDFLNHIQGTVAMAPERSWVFIADQLNTHMSESLVRFVAKECGIDIELGVKGKSGVLTSKKSRRAFLEDRTHRIRFLYTPRHTSWLNQVEIWFSILSRRLLKRGDFSSLDSLGAKLEAFIEYFNTALAKPFRWTYTGRPLTV